MAKLSLDLNSFKSAGVYTIEIDQSERIVVSSQSLRLVPGFSEVGPQNTPVFISSTNDLYKFYGTKNTQLERKGSYFHRTIETCLLSSPVFAISLLNVDTRSNQLNEDIVGTSTWGVEPISKNEFSFIPANPNIQGSVDMMDGFENAVVELPYYQLFDRSRFWKPSDENLQGSVMKKLGYAGENEDFSVIQIGNIGTTDFSVVISKATNLKKFDVLAKDWYGNETNIPYKWIKPYNYISDYFINILVLEGKHTIKNRLQINRDIANGNVNVIGNWTGTIIPEFRDGMGANYFIEDVVNANVALTNVLLNINKDALEFNEDIVIDFLGESLSDIEIAPNKPANVNFLSYKFDISDESTLFSTFAISKPTDSMSEIYGQSCFVIKDANESKNLNIGDFVIMDGKLIRINNKLSTKYTISETINGNTTNKDIIATVYSVVDNETKIEFDDTGNAIITRQEAITSPLINNMYHFKYLKGLELKKCHKPGYSGNFDGATPSAEEGVKKIYGMLMDTGILRGLINPDMISYRYIVDSMGYGLQPLMGGKSYLSLLAKKRGKCTAILNAPSMQQFSKAQDPYFCDTFSANEPTPVFNTKWIAEGGNPNMVRSFSFTLPDEENGAKYCGVFGPYLKYNDNGRTISVPPAADVSNAYVRKFMGGDPYAIVANRNGLLSNMNILGVEYMLDKEDRDNLEPFGYNSIIERPQTGEVMIYANATSFQTINSDFNYLHVREILNTIEIDVEDILKRFVFERNNEVTRLTCINSVTPILQAMQDSGALYRYEVVMDSSNNTDAIVDEGFAIIDIGVWITKGMEKIVQRISVNKLDTTNSGGSVNV